MSGHPVLPAEQITLPLLPLRDVVVFPHMVIPLFVGRPKSIKALEAAMEAGRRSCWSRRRPPAKDEPERRRHVRGRLRLHILQMLKLPDGTVKVLVEGVQRARIAQHRRRRRALRRRRRRRSPPRSRADAPRSRRCAARSSQQFDQYVKLNKKIPPEILTSIAGIDDAGRLADTIAAHLPLKLEKKQSVLDLFDVDKRLEKLLEQLEHEVDILQVEKRIRGRVKRQMEKSQREYYLNEQVKAIQKELGEGEEGADIEELEKKINAAKMPKEARKKADAELKKLKLMSPMSAEATVVRNYIDTLVDLPWTKKTKIKHDLAHRREGAQRGPLRPREGQGPHPRVPRGAAARRQGEGADPVPGRPAGRRQDLARPVDRPGDRTASSCAWRSAACATRPRSAATAAPTSARCRARCCRA